LPTVLPAAAWWHDWACQRVPELIQRASPLATVRSGWPEWLSPLFSARLRQLGLVTEATSPLELPSPATHFAAFMQSAPLGLRVNLLRGGRAEVLAQLQHEKLEARAGRLSPLALLLSRRPRLQQWPLWRDGHLEVHDEGSQLIAPALVYALKPGGADAPMRVLDACAGGGGKTLHLAAELPRGAQLFASDKSAQRLAPLAERARRAGVKAIRMLPLEEACALRDLDAVLIDAPCTGLGTLRRHPELLWRVTECDVAMRTAQQRAILRAHAAGPRVGGLLVYATCSFLAAENDDIIAAFLDEYPNYRSESPLPAWRAWHATHNSVAPASLAQGATQYGHQLLPCLHGCDGFFVSVLRKISA
jgi:16S rRNA (cytosine967-C5)-methyltransferase